MKKKEKKTTNELVSELTKQGLKVKCRHVRYFPTVSAEDESGLPDFFLTRGEYNTHLENENIFDEYHFHADTPYCKAVGNFGGFTVVEIFKGNELVTSGKKNFGRMEQFNKKIGRSVALHKALGKVNVNT